MIKYLWRWHPKVALRYLPIVRKINKSRIKDPLILEIGSGSLGITPYLGRKVTGLDVNFVGPQIDLLDKVKGSATLLPFKDKSFDITVCVDVLEHLSKENRIKLIREAIRVTKNNLIIAVPCGALSQKEDDSLSKSYKHIYGKPFPFYLEHKKYRLPEEKWVSDTINKEAVRKGRKITLNVEGNVNMSLHRFLMQGWMTKSFIVDLVFRKIFLLFIPLMRILNKEPTYRKIFYVDFSK